MAYTATDSVDSNLSMIQRFVSSGIIVAACMLFASCGQAEDRSVPDWMIGKWRLLHIQTDDVRTNMKPFRRKSFLTVAKSGIHFDYPSCKADADMTTELDKPMISSNNYALTITKADCTLQWGIKKYPGAVDEGFFWGYKDDSGALTMIRTSTLEDIQWVYKKDS